MITAKVKCVNKEESSYQTNEGTVRQARVTFYADYADGRNKEWASATPTLNLTMTLNGHAADLFDQGTAYTLQFVEDEA